MKTIIDEYIVVAIDNFGECHPVAYGCCFLYGECHRIIEKLGQHSYDRMEDSDGVVVEVGQKLPIVAPEDIISYFQSERTETMETAMAASGIGELTIRSFVAVATDRHELMTCSEYEQKGMYSARLNLQNIPSQIACKSAYDLAKLIYEMGIDGLRYFINCPK